MQRIVLSALFAALLGVPVLAQPLSLTPHYYGAPVPRAAMPMTPPMVVAAPPMVMAAPRPAERRNLGGGFIEFLFGERVPEAPAMLPPPGAQYDPMRAPQPLYANAAPGLAPYAEPTAIDPRYLRQEVEYHGKEAPGTIVIDTPNRFLFLVGEGGRATRYGIGVGRPGFTWSGTHKVSAKKEWPDWVPPEEMLARQPYLPHHVAGGPNNPLGARALYLGSTLYRIHGSNEPWTIGQMVSSGCIRMRNEDVVDLYERVKIGTKVVVI